MKLEYVLVRAFNQDKWWELYTKANNTKIRLIKKWCTFRFMRMAAKNGGYIGPETQIKGKPDFKHDFHGICINRNAVIGKNVSIGPNVIIGTRGAGSPTIGDNVYIGANAILIGEIQVGANAKIGAGAVVVSDVPAGATVVGPKVKILIKEHMENTYET